MTITLSSVRLLAVEGVNKYSIPTHFSTLRTVKDWKHTQDDTDFFDSTDFNFKKSINKFKLGISPIVNINTLERWWSPTTPPDLYLPCLQILLMDLHPHKFNNFKLRNATCMHTSRPKLYISQIWLAVHNVGTYDDHSQISKLTYNITQIGIIVFMKISNKLLLEESDLATYGTWSREAQTE